MNIFAAVALIAILVFIHEFGHFIVAKACGVEVTVLSIGFGRRLFGVEIGGTDYRLSVLPFGGYVKMAGADPFGTGAEDDDILDDPSRAFLRRPVWQRLLVVAAGPAFNLALPLVLFTVLLMAGEPQPASFVGGVQHGSIADEVGLVPGDRIVGIDGASITTWGELSKTVSDWSDGPHTLLVDRDGVNRPVTIDWDDDAQDEGLGMSQMRPSMMVGVDDSASPAGRVEIRTGDEIAQVDGHPVEDWIALEARLANVGASFTATLVDGRIIEVERDGLFKPNGLVGATEAFGLAPATLFVAEVGERLDKDTTDVLSGCRPAATKPPAPAYEAGLQAGDRFLRLDGVRVEGWGDVLRGVRETMEGDGDTATARPMDIEVVRDGSIVQLNITPMVVRDTNALGRYYHRPVLGVMRMGGFVDGPTTRVYYSLPNAMKRSWIETSLITGYIVEQIGKLLTGGAAIQRTLGGPVEMVRQASQAAEKGLFAWARLMGMLSISLGIINFLPVPVLDGGQFLFYLVEGLRGRPLSVAIRERAQQVGVLFLVLLMLSVLLFDIQRLFE